MASAAKKWAWPPWAWMSLTRGVAAFRVASENGDLRAGLRQAFSNGSAQNTRGANDDRDFAGEIK